MSDYHMLGPKNYLQHYPFLRGRLRRDLLGRLFQITRELISLVLLVLS